MNTRLRFVPLLALLLVFLGAILSSGRCQFVVSHTFTIKYVIDPKQVDYVVDLFRNRLLARDPAARVIWCKNVTRVALDGAKDFALGAACDVRRANLTLPALLCENSRSGDLICAQSRATAREEVIQFTEDNCLPRGGP